MSEDKKSRRKLKNFFSSTARLEGRYHYNLMFVSLIFMTVAVLYILHTVKNITQHIQSVSKNDELIAEMIFASLDHLLIITICGFVIYFMFTMVFVLIIEQKVGGPTVAILKNIEAIKEGDYDYKRELRSGDELTSVMAALKDLQQHLKNKYRK